MNKYEIDKILRDHKLYLIRDGGERADFSGAILVDADFSHADLRDADFSVADLSDAYFRRADLRDADFSCAYLRDADFRRADLRDADFSGAILVDADFSGADLRDADFLNANFSGAILKDCIISDKEIPVIENIKSKIPKYLVKMQNWHSDCGTAHCLAGWACHLANEPELEEDLGTNTLGAFVFFQSCGEVPDFYSTDEEAIEWLNK